MPLAVIAQPWWWPARRACHQHRKRKTDTARDEQRAQWILLHLLRNSFRTRSESLAVLVSILGIVGPGVADAACGILSLSVKILRRTSRLPRKS